MDRREFLALGSAAALGLRRPCSPSARPAVVFVFLRGGADGLSIVVPHGDARYYRARPHCAVPPRHVIDLDGYCGLHSALAPLKPWWDHGSLAVAAASGFPARLSSHLDAQLRVDRWLAQLDAEPCASLGEAAETLGRRGTPATLVVNSWGWDTHVAQGSADGLLAARLRRLGADIDAFTRAAGPRMRDIVLVTVSEFGRGIRENAFGGTSHGHATALLALGGPVAGGVLWGQWPGLDGGDVAVTADLGTLFERAVHPHTLA